MVGDARAHAAAADDHDVRCRFHSGDYRLGSGFEFRVQRFGFRFGRALRVLAQIDQCSVAIARQPIDEERGVHSSPAAWLERLRVLRQIRRVSTWRAHRTIAEESADSGPRCRSICRVCARIANGDTMNYLRDALDSQYDHGAEHAILHR